MSHSIKYVSIVLVVLLITFAASFPPQLISDDTNLEELEVVDQSDWPREIVTNRGVVVIYQPQLESFEGNMLSGRAAVGIERENEETVFGAFWFEARLETDREDRFALITDVDVSDVRFPNQTDEQVKNFSGLLEAEIPKWNLPIELDELIAAMELVETQEAAASNINTDPPVVLFYAEPVVLITIDGEPRLVDSGEQDIQRVANTPFTILYDTKKKVYYLFADEDSWFTAFQLKGEWQSVDKVPSAIAKLAPPDNPEEEGESDEMAGDDMDGEEGIETGPPPKIAVATEPTELISSDGQPKYETIEGTQLLSISNTDSDVLFDTDSQQHYILLSGRWFTSQSLNGPWTFVASTELPSDFAKIPEDSEMGTVLYAVADTEVAREAVMDAQVPQTAAVEKSKASLTVEYDSTPKFERIEGTSMDWAANTATPVIKVSNTYYAVDEAVWFVSGSPQGPWAVATSVPDVIYTIPANSPVYNVTFVRIYGETDDVVYVGYTPGYTNTYVYNTTIVYGTGYYYPGWYGRYYYPRYATWGFHVRWNPWTGWGYGFSYGWGPYSFYFGAGLWFRGGWFGPGRYVGYRRGYRRGYRHGYRRGYRRGARAGYRAGSRNASSRNMYHSNRNKARTTNSTGATRNNARSNASIDRSQASRAASSGRANNVYADKNGNVHRKTDQGWQQRSGDSWKTSDNRSQTTRDSSQQRTQQSTQQRSQQSTQQRTQQSSGANRNYGSELDRSYNSRQRGQQRSSSYRSSSRRSGGRRR